MQLTSDIDHAEQLTKTELASWFSFASTSGVGTAFEEDGYTILNCRTRSPIFNRAFFAQSSDVTPERLEQVHAYFSTERLSYSLFFPGCDSIDVEAICDRFTMTREIQPAIVAPAQLHSRSVAGVEIRRVGTDSEIDDYVRVACEAFGTEYDDVRPLANVDLFVSRCIQGFTAYDRDEPVGTVSIACIENMAFIADLTTRSDRRAHGIAQSLLSRALESAVRAGCDYVGGHASPDVEKWYAWLGGRTVQKWELLSRSASKKL